MLFLVGKNLSRFSLFFTVCICNTILKQGEGFDISQGKSGVDEWNSIVHYTFTVCICRKPRVLYKYKPRMCNEQITSRQRKYILKENTAKVQISKILHLNSNYKSTHSSYTNSIKIEGIIEKSWTCCNRLHTLSCSDSHPLYNTALSSRRSLPSFSLKCRWMLQNNAW